MRVAALLIAMTLGHMSSSAQTTRPASAPAAFDDYLTKQLDDLQIPSISVGIVHGGALVYAKSLGCADLETQRAATPDTIYRIASLSKVFTTALLAVLRDDGVVRLDDPVSGYLPPEVKLPSDPRGAPAITLRHLATHTSGLPRLPHNVVPKDGDMYGGYTPEALYRALGETRLVAPIGARDEYSNFGMGLLGHVLERAAGKPFEALLREKICSPLGMERTRIALRDADRADAAIGYMMASLVAAPEWDFGCLAGCGGLASSVNDLAKFIVLQLKAGEAGVAPIRGGTLRELHAPQHISPGWEHGVGLGWHVLHNDRDGNIVWHNGSTFGFGSYVAFIPRHDVGVIVLINRGSIDGAADQIGGWLLDRAVERYGEKKPSSRRD